MGYPSLMAPAQTLPPDLSSARIAVLVPCYNEEATIGAVVTAFRQVLPDAQIFVYDNASSDHTMDEAAKAGAIVRSEKLSGKGNVVRRMFADCDADIYVIVDGDNTYDAAAAPALIARLRADRLDMVVGTRVASGKAAYRRGHRFGNRILTGLVARLFGRAFTDMLSGYRVMTRRFVKSFPADARGFEVETELAIHALELRAPSAEVPTNYDERPPGSLSKLRTFRDGARIIWFIARLIERERPMLFYGALAAATLFSALLFSLPVLQAYYETGFVDRLPTWILSLSLGVAGALFGACGLILNATHTMRVEARRLAYLAIPLLP